MQSIFRLPWCSDPIATKSDHALLDKMRASPVVEIPSLNKLKRKRTVGSDASPKWAHDNKKSRPGHYESQVQLVNFQQPATPTFAEKPVPTLETASAATSQIAQANSGAAQAPPEGSSSTIALLQSHAKPTNMDSPVDATMSDLQVPASDDVKGFTPLQQVIENQFNMQILMKHNELRLIEQELAKCQTALEQLRRCELRPYPGSEGLSEAVSAGTGPAVTPLPGFTRPSHPAPHGVTDGPYSRHYRQWLLSDPHFDSVPVQMLQPDAGGRPSRAGGPTSRRSASGQSFTFQPRPSEKLPALPNYPTPASSKDKNLPNVLRRSTDGQLVKLICNNCQRGNFSSIQGFLNHCRIAHKVDYKSHDAAAIDCGVPLDESEAATLPVEAQHTSAPKPPVTRAAAVPASSSTPSRNYVHPFNSASGGAVILNQPRKPVAPRQAVQTLAPAAPPTAPTQFTPSAQVPRLSAHFAKHHVGGDLAKLAADARQKVDLSSDYYDLPSSDVSEQNSPAGTPAGSRTFATGGRTGTLGVNSDSIPRPPSRKGVRQLMPQPKARPSPLVPINNSPVVKHEQSESPESLHSHDHYLSPHTADSNPGLVSDHEDDAGSASESEEAPVPHSPATRPMSVPGNGTSCVDSMELDVAVEDDEIERDGLIIRRNSLSGEGRKFGPPGKRGV